MANITCVCNLDGMCWHPSRKLPAITDGDCLACSVDGEPMVVHGTAACKPCEEKRRQETKPVWQRHWTELL